MSRNCPICSSFEKEFIYKQNFNSKVISLMDNYDVVVCRNCGFVYADNIPSQADFSNYYAIMSKYEFNYKEGNVSDDYINYFTKIVEFLFPHINKDSKNTGYRLFNGGIVSFVEIKGLS